MNDNLGLGSGRIKQISISEEVDQVKIEKIFLENLIFFEKFLKENNDKYGQEILDSLIKGKKLNFTVNKHTELFITKNQKDIKKIIKYIIFRYKFLKSGKDKINLTYPPYIIIEPVSTCNLRCPFCFQTDKSFTRKPYMGVMNFQLFKKVVDEANDIGVGAISLASRGEPTMHKQLAEMLEYAGKKENIFEIKLNTNATFLNDKICHAVFKNNVTQVVISADHYIKENFEKLRLNSKFEEVVKNADLLFNTRKKHYPNSLTEIRVSGIDLERNLDRKKFKEFWIKRCDHVTASFPLERWNTYENKKHPSINDPCENFWDRMYVWFEVKFNTC
jgi:MoaA/NifB/PqqE/SkfB family radical SAM enzyme